MRWCTLVLVVTPLAACAPPVAPVPRVAAADPESAAVWGAALDAEYLNDRTYGRFEMVVDTLARPMAGGDSISLRHLRRWFDARRFPPELLDALVRPDTSAVRIDVAAVDRATELRLAAQPSDPRAAAEVRRRYDNHEGVGLVYLSRVLFSHDRRSAIVSVFVSCGNRCGRGGLLMMRRGDDGRWVVAGKPQGSYS